MTRINSNLNPEILFDQHLMAEYRELPMVYGSLTRSLRTQSVDKILSKIPRTFTLNKGHVTFFYDKLLFLEKRYERLKNHLIDRGFKLNENRNRYDINLFPKEFLNDWDSSKHDDEIVLLRIKEKFSMKPSWYRYYGQKIKMENYNDMF